MYTAHVYVSLQQIVAPPSATSYKTQYTNLVQQHSLPLRNQRQITQKHTHDLERMVRTKSKGGICRMPQKILFRRAILFYSGSCFIEVWACRILKKRSGCYAQQGAVCLLGSKKMLGFRTLKERLGCLTLQGEV